MAVGVEPDALQADNANAAMVITIKYAFFILAYDFPLVLLSFVMTPSCNVTTRSA